MCAGVLLRGCAAVAAPALEISVLSPRRWVGAAGSTARSASLRATADSARNGLRRRPVSGPSCAAYEQRDFRHLMGRELRQKPWRTRDDADSEAWKTSLMGVAPACEGSFSSRSVDGQSAIARASLMMVCPRRAPGPLVSSAIFERS